MTTLHDYLDDAVADVRADLPTLTTASRRQGLGIRRRRRALATVGATAVVAMAAAVSVPLVTGGHDDTLAVGMANPVRVGLLSGETAPATDRAVVAALVDAVDQAADGTYGRLQGQAGQEAFASLVFDPYGESGPPGQVMINLQPLDETTSPPYDCSATWLSTDCSVRELANGDTIRSYWDLDDTEHGAGSQRMAVEVLSPDRDLRVVVNALNTTSWTVGDYRRQPALTLEQATEIATLPWWGRTELPVEYVEAGRTLDLFEG